MNIFTTIYKGEYKATLRSLQFSLLQKLAGANAAKFECFRPVIGGLPTQQSEQERKAEFVELFNQMLLAGVNFDSLPTGCGCEDLIGNICTVAGSGYAELIQGITDAPTQTIVTSCDAVLSSDANTDIFSFTLPEGATLIGLTLNGNGLGAGLAQISISNVTVVDGTTIVFLSTPVDSGELSLCYTYTI